MNLHRYKAKLTSPGSGETRFEFLGTWIGFGGMLALIANVGAVDFARDVFGHFVLAVGVSYGLYWFATANKVFLYLLTFLSFILCLALTGFLLLGPDCEALKVSYRINSCSRDETAKIIYAVYFGSLFVIGAYYANKVRKGAA